MANGMTEEKALAECERRYLFDAEFHAKVKMVEHAVAFDLLTKTGSQMSYRDRSLARLAAGLALILEED